jgi:hypothetical protein
MILVRILFLTPRSRIVYLVNQLNRKSLKHLISINAGTLSTIMIIVNTDFPYLENRASMLENRNWCGEHINVLEDAIHHRMSVHHDISNHNDLNSDVLIPKQSEDEIYDMKIRQIREEYFRDLDEGMSEQHASSKKIAAE